MKANNEKARWLLAAFHAVLDYTSTPVIVEFGGMRFPYEVPSDGASTQHFFTWLEELGQGDLYSVDTDPAVCAANRERFASPHVHILESGDFLDSFAGMIDLLYLDSVREATAHQLQSVLPKLHPNAVIAMDDTHAHDGEPFGKAAAVIPILRHQRWFMCDVPTEALEPDTWYRMALWRKQWPMLV